MKQDGQYVMDLAVGNPNGFLVVSVVLTHFQVVLVNFVFFWTYPGGPVLRLKYYVIFPYKLHISNVIERNWTQSERNLNVIRTVYGYSRPQHGYSRPKWNCENNTFFENNLVFNLFWKSYHGMMGGHLAKPPKSNGIKGFTMGRPLALRLKAV